MRFKKGTHVRIGDTVALGAGLALTEDDDGLVKLEGGEAVGAFALDDLSDVSVSSPSTGQFLRKSAGDWLNTLLVAGDLPAHSSAHDDRFYTESEISGDGTSSVHWNNLTNKPQIVTGTGTQDWVPRWTSTSNIGDSKVEAENATWTTSSWERVLRVQGADMIGFWPSAEVTAAYYGIGCTGDEGVLYIMSTDQTGAGGTAQYFLQFQHSTDMIRAVANIDFEDGYTYAFKNTGASAPFTVSSTTQVTNLNASQLEGQDLAGVRNHTPQSHDMITSHTDSGLTVGDIIRADTATSFAWITPVISHMSDVNVGTPVAGEFLRWSVGSSEWVDSTIQISDLPTHDPSNHDIISFHTASGLTGGHFLKADTATTFSFQVHGLTASDVSALADTAGIGDLSDVT
ncbi:MAG: hypothetical protein ACW99Q_00425, partial [Candidatus Kariarchaeaceae archaeon]